MTLGGERGESRRILIVNGDDFGRTPSTNEGVLRAHEQGILTSASLMVRWPSARAAAKAAAGHPSLSVGLHVDLCEYHQRSRGDWGIVYSVVPLEYEPVRTEARRQLEEFRRLTGRDPTHVDSHQHVHLRPGVAEALDELAGELDVPVRERNGRIRFYGGFFGQASDGTPMPELTTPGALAQTVAELEPGVTELGCHPGVGHDSWSTYDRERALEVEALCHPGVRQAVTDNAIELRSFAGLG